MIEVGIKFFMGENNMKKKIVVILVAAVLVAGLFSAYKFGLFSGDSTNDSESEIYVSPLSDYVGVNNGYSTNVYMGIVEGQETTGINKSSEREIDEIFVSEGDVIEEGDKLFSYKTDSLLEEITQFGFDIEGYNLSIADLNRQINAINLSISKTENYAEKEDFYNQIEGLKTQIAIAENNIEKTNAKIADAQKKIDNSIVYSTASGQITKIQTDTTNSDYSSDGYFITLLASKELRVKGTINEQNVWSINIDEPVVLRSRVNPEQTWTGTITKIETESKAEDGSNNMSDGQSSDNKSTSYPFYITLDSSENLMMGQHLYIELGEQTESVDLSSATYVPEYMLAYDENGNPYVWKMGKSSKLVKANVELGQYLEDFGFYEVTSGELTYDDCIAYPMDDYSEGMACISSFEGE